MPIFIGKEYWASGWEECEPFLPSHNWGGGGVEDTSLICNGFVDPVSETGRDWGLKSG